MKWTVGALVKRASEILKSRGIKSARLDAELLLAHALGFKDRVKLYSEFDKPLTDEEVENYRQLIIRRAKGEPVAYITGKKEFFGFTFRVEKGVLIPRPETELLVEIVYEYLKDKEGKTVVDVGTGSGCIAISLCKLLGAKHRFYGIDISKIALEVAEKNRKILGCKNVTFFQSDLLEKVDFPVDVVVSNPPYVPLNDAELEESVKKFEPAVALFGGKDGLDIIRRLVEESYKKLNNGGLIAVEVGKGQSEKVKELFKGVGFRNVNSYADLSGIERVVAGVK